MKERASDACGWRNETMIKRYECIRDTHRMGNDGPWVTYEDHAEEITTLRADVERWVKAVAHLKLSAEKAERISNEPSR